MIQNEQILQINNTQLINSLNSIIKRYLLEQDKWCFLLSLTKEERKDIIHAFYYYSSPSTHLSEFENLYSPFILLKSNYITLDVSQNIKAFLDKLCTDSSELPSALEPKEYA